MKRALIAIRKGGGSGVIGSHGSLLVAGEMLSFEPVTYLRLVAHGIMGGCGGRIMLTDDGIAVADEITPTKERSRTEAQWDDDAEFQMKDQHL